MPKVSVIIPVYGVEKYIERCARSLFEQTLDDIEYLFIDDCTPDKSVEVLKQVLEEYPARKEQVVIHRMEKNSGQAAVRTWGMQNATGDFVIHCDSDDWVDTDMYRAMYEKALEENVDVVVCDFVRTDGGDFYKYEKGAHTEDLKTFIVNALFQRDHWSLCNKMFKRTSYYKELTYPKGALGEDMLMCIQLLSDCKKMAYVAKPFYNYYYNPNSITKKKTEENYISNYYTLKDNTDELFDIIDQRVECSLKLKKQAKLYLRMVNSFSLMNIKHKQEYKSLWKEAFPWMPLSFYLNYRISLYNKVVYTLLRLGIFPRKQDKVG